MKGETLDSLNGLGKLYADFGMLVDLFLTVVCPGCCPCALHGLEDMVCSYHPPPIWS